MKDPVRGSTAWFSLTAIALALVVFQAATLRDQPLAELHSTWRYWDDMALAATRYLSWTQAEPPPPAIAVLKAAPPFQEIVERQTQRQSVQPWEFWLTVPEKAIAQWEWRALPAPLEDVGRSQWLAVAFLAVGGIAPYLLVWLGLLVALPLLLWAACELRDAGWPAAGPALIAACAVSPFVLETLTLPHSAVGFYLCGLFALVALTAWAARPEPGSWPGFVLRFGAASLVFALGTVARAGTLLLLPGFALALHWAGQRQRRLATTHPEPWRRALGHTMLLVTLFTLPYLALRPAAYHNVWLSLWEGLGDFGQDRGYSWYDVDANRALARGGLAPFADPKDVTREHERFFRDRLLEDIGGHPVWYVGVLTRRTLATLGLTHLLPWTPIDGDALGTPRFHYKYTTPVDWIGFGGVGLELPVQVLWLPPLAVVAWAALARRRARPGEPPHASRRAAMMLAPPIVACLPLPVLVTTAAGLETQAIAIAYFLALGLLLDLVSATRFRNSSTAAATASEPPRNPRQE